MAEGGDRLAVLNRSERLAEEKERILRECAPLQRRKQTRSSSPMYRAQPLCACPIVGEERCESAPDTVIVAGTEMQAPRRPAVQQQAALSVQCAAYAGTSRRTRGACAA